MADSGHLMKHFRSAQSEEVGKTLKSMSGIYCFWGILFGFDLGNPSLLFIDMVKCIALVSFSGSTHPPNIYSQDDLPKAVVRNLNQGSNVMSMDFHPQQQTVLLG